MFSILLVLARAAHAVISLESVSAAVCGCGDGCLVADLALGTPFSFVAYPNSNLTVVDFVGAVRGFLPGGAFSLVSQNQSVACALSRYALIQNGAVVQDDFLSQVDSKTCGGATAAAASADYALALILTQLSYLGNDTFTVRKNPIGVPNAVVDGFAPAAGINLTLSGAPADCVLPASFAFCGATFTQDGCLGDYTGACASANYTPPIGCEGDALFASPLSPTPPYVTTPAGISVMTTTAVLSSVFAAGLSVASSTLSAVQLPLVGFVAYVPPAGPRPPGGFRAGDDIP